MVNGLGLYTGLSFLLALHVISMSNRRTSLRSETGTTEILKKNSNLNQEVLQLGDLQRETFCSKGHCIGAL